MMKFTLNGSIKLSEGCQFDDLNRLPKGRKIVSNYEWIDFIYQRRMIHRLPSTQ